MVYEPEEKQWYRKTVRCNRCGKCCLGPLADDWFQGTQMIDGVEYCGAIKEAGGEYWCEAKQAPFGCAMDSPHRLPHPECVMEYEKI